ncbi:mucoidy inhibitor MuiA family protein [Pyxidicoccus fallax]|uniref:Mucoidy inhibitor MuiA family protein n=1 Tax=Pyxidicoccus fallax TaxID=394095 RepID=A0A848LSV3_9BACT|nr:mucoidy inhibitor MuiA family protein [Pyxidicoccus fallax]NMO20702.1 mucoidy inhibitor MuiA family protein [Pyxidicoccus fallax]NPC82528.1 mucoidy inhibitor MuiA family protein [Pyxidicoccus fallax]
MSAPLSLPVVKVTVLEDRALVERRGEVPLVAGAQRVVIEGLSPLAVDRSLQAKLSGGTVSQARIRRAMKPFRPEALREHRTELGRRLAELEQALRRAEAEADRRRHRHTLLMQAHEDVFRAISEDAGSGQDRPELWRQQLATVRRELDAADTALREAGREVARVRQRHQEAQSALAVTEREEPRLDVHAELEVGHPAGGSATLSLTYLVPCAAWRPAYRALLERGDKGDTVTLECEAVVWQRTEEEWKDVELAFSTARPTLGASPPRLVEDWLWLRDKTEREKQVVEVAMREEVIQTTGEGGTTRREEALPGMDDGGEPLTLAARHRATVPADGESHRVPLFRFSAPATSELVAYPEQSQLVHRVARFDNTGPAVLLAGPVDLVRSSGYVGRAQLRFTGRNERVKLGFGSEDALRVARKAEEEVETSRLTGRRVRTQRVKLFLSNMGAKPEAVALEERMPVSEVESVEVMLQREGTKPAPARVSEDGIIRFELTAPPRSQQELSLAYTVTSASKVAGL